MSASSAPNDRPGTARHAEFVAARDRDWVARIRRGDVDAFEAVYRAYKNELGGFVESYTRSREAAEEVIQDLFCKLWEQRELWEFPGPLNTYLFRAARNRAMTHLRRTRIETRFLERSTGQPDLASAAKSEATDLPVQLGELEDAIEGAVAALPERCREVFRLNRYHHLSYAEVAQVMQISVKTVEVQMGRALTALRARLAEWRK